MKLPRNEMHPSILEIKKNVNGENKFLFTNTTENAFKDEINKLDPSKAGIENNIPTKILISSSDIVCNHLSHIYNYTKNDNAYPQSLKLADVTLKDYRPVSLIPIVSKLFERDMYSLILAYIDTFLPSYLLGYRQGYTQPVFNSDGRKMEKALDGKECVGAILTDLSKAFDCLNHDLLIAKLDPYGFEKSALTFIYNYLKERKQRTKENGSYSSWQELKFGVPQGSILGPLLFNIFINDMFSFIKDTNIANYADVSTLYTVEGNIDDLLNTLKNETSLILNWFRMNEMKSNDDKCHLFVTNQDSVSGNGLC